MARLFAVFFLASQALANAHCRAPQSAANTLPSEKIRDASLSYKEVGIVDSNILMSLDSRN
jgi:hypothetical protein